MIQQKKSPIYLVFAGVVIVSLFVVLGCVLELKSEAASGSPITFTIAENPYTAEVYGDKAVLYADNLSIHFERKTGTQWYQWHEAEGQTFSISYSSQSDSVFKIHNWGGYTYYLEFVNNDTGVVDYVMKATGETFNVGIDTYVYASDLPGRSYTVVLSQQAKYFPHSTDVSGSLTFVALFPDGSTHKLITYSNFISFYPSDAKICNAIEYKHFFTTIDGAYIDPKYYEDGAYWVITDSSNRTIYVDYIVPDFRALTVRYLDEYGRFMALNATKVLKISQNGGTIDIPMLDGVSDCSVFPQHYAYNAGTNPLSLDVYLVPTVSTDTNGSFQDGYSHGFGEGYDVGLKESAMSYDSGYKEGYNVGYDKGIHQNSLTGAQISELRKDYNVITGFFDGMWNWMRDFFTTVTEGVGFGGVTVGDVIWTLVIIAVVLWIGGKVL